MTLQSENKKKPVLKIVVIVLGAVLGLCVICFAFAAYMGSRPEFVASMTATAQVIAGGTAVEGANAEGAAIQAVLTETEFFTRTAPVRTSTPTADPGFTETVAITDTPTQTFTPFPTPTVTPTNTSTPTKTPLPKIDLSLSQFFYKYDHLTDIQRDSFLLESTGKWVSWSGRVREVFDDGTVSIDVPGSTWSVVHLAGLPQEEAVAIVKDSTIYFEGMISKIDTFLIFTVEITDVRILP